MNERYNKYSDKCLLLLYDDHNCIDVVYLVYLTLLHISATQISHYHVQHGQPKLLVVLNKPNIQYLYSCVFVG